MGSPPNPRQTPTRQAHNDVEPGPSAAVDQPPLELDHFNWLVCLGRGSFGQVMLSEHRISRKLYAIKVLKKAIVIQNDEVENVRAEKRMFLLANQEKHPFVLDFLGCFQTPGCLLFVMPYLCGGDLMLHLQRGPFGVERSRLYAAEMSLAIQFFHQNGIIHRNLKLENVLLDPQGHIKITGYGVCKNDIWHGSTTRTFCGSAEFMAPEILLDRTYGRPVDWWALGIMMYQMLLQQSPFRGDDEDQIYDALLGSEPSYPVDMPPESVSILRQLLAKDPRHRLGSGPTDAQEIMSHAFFSRTNWGDIYNKRIPVPFTPQISSPTDTSNFDLQLTSTSSTLNSVESDLSMAMQEEFHGFDYAADLV